MLVYCPLLLFHVQFIATKLTLCSYKFVKQKCSIFSILIPQSRTHFFPRIMTYYGESPSNITKFYPMDSKRQLKNMFYFYDALRKGRAGVGPISLSISPFRFVPSPPILNYFFNSLHTLGKLLDMNWAIFICTRFLLQFAPPDNFKRCLWYVCLSQLKN